jgi:CheY-like chemotaxis protein
MSCTDDARPALILVVDDEVAFRDIVAQVLRDEGYRVEVASDGRRALDLMTKERPGLVLLDLMMPALSGQEVMAQMGTSRQLATVPVLVLSGVADPVLDRRAARIVGVMRKPVVLHALLSKVGSIVPPPKRAP